MKEMFDEFLGPIRRQLSELGERVEYLEEENYQLKEALRVNEDRDRRKNLVFWKVPEQQGEDCRRKVIDLIKDNLRINIKEDDIERAHRLHTRTQPRPMIVRFERHLTKETIWKSRKSVTSEIRFSEDFSFATRRARQQLQNLAKEAREEGKFPLFVVDKLIIGDTIYRYNGYADKIEHAKRKPTYQNKSMNMYNDQGQANKESEKGRRAKRGLMTSPRNAEYSSPARKQKLGDIRTYYQAKKDNNNGGRLSQTESTGACGGTTSIWRQKFGSSTEIFHDSEDMEETQ